MFILFSYIDVICIYQSVWYLLACSAVVHINISLITMMTSVGDFQIFAICDHAAFIFLINVLSSLVLSKFSFFSIFPVRLLTYSFAISVRGKYVFVESPAPFLFVLLSANYEN